MRARRAQTRPHRSYRSGFVTGFAFVVNTGRLNQAMTGCADPDASLSYSLTRNLQIAVRGVNPTDKIHCQACGTRQVPSNLHLGGRQLVASVTDRW